MKFYGHFSSTSVGIITSSNKSSIQCWITHIDICRVLFWYNLCITKRKNNCPRKLIFYIRDNKMRQTFCSNCPSGKIIFLQTVCLICVPQCNANYVIVLIFVFFNANLIILFLCWFCLFAIYTVYLFLKATTVNSSWCSWCTCSLWLILYHDAERSEKFFR